MTKTNLPVGKEVIPEAILPCAPGTVETQPGVETPKISNSLPASSDTVQHALAVPVFHMNSEASKLELLSLEQRRLRLEADLEKLTANYLKTKTEVALQLDQIQQETNLLKDRVNTRWYSMGANLIEVQGFLSRHNTSNRLKVVEKAIADLTKMPYNRFGKDQPHLATGYYATKDFGTYTDQLCQYNYGWGPAHGKIRFRVGLSLKGQALVGTNQFDDSWAAVAIYYLRVVMQRGTH